MAKPLYSCSQNALVSACTKAINLCIENSAELVKAKPFLDAPYFEQIKVDLKAADLMPDSKTLSALTNLAYMKADSDRDFFLKQFALLKTHIEDGNDAADHKNLFKIAGNENFSKARKGSWNDLKGIISSALPFVHDNKADLMERKIMPTAFPEIFETAANNVTESYEKWDKLSKGASKADPKIDALNAVYVKVIAALKVGQIHFEDTNPALYKQFIFNNLLAQTQGIPNAGISGKIMGKDQKGIKKVVVLVEGSDKITESDDDGKFELTPLSKGKYKVIVQCEGYETQVFEDFAVKTGVMSRLNTVLIPLGAAA